jgi:hypothetical protein
VACLEETPEILGVRMVDIRRRRVEGRANHGGQSLDRGTELNVGVGVL